MLKPGKYRIQGVTDSDVDTYAYDSYIRDGYVVEIGAPYVGLVRHAYKLVNHEGPNLWVKEKHLAPFDPIWCREN